MEESSIDNSAGTSDIHVGASKQLKPLAKTPAERQRKWRLKKKLMSEEQNIPKAAKRFKSESILLI